MVGTGASAIQFVPEIQPKVGKLHVFQRTAPVGHPAPQPAAQALGAGALPALPAGPARHAGGDLLGARAVRAPVPPPRRSAGCSSSIPLAHMRKQVKDPELREKLTPDYRIGCKRILPTDEWYPALAQPNVEVVTERDHARSGRTRWSPRTAPSARSTRSSSAPAST